MLPAVMVLSRYPGDGRSGYVCDLQLTAHANRAGNQTWRAGDFRPLLSQSERHRKMPPPAKGPRQQVRLPEGAPPPDPQSDRARAGRNISTGAFIDPRQR